MARTGLTDNLLVAQLNATYDAHKLIEASAELQTLNMIHVKTVEILKDLSASRDIALLLSAEQLLLSQELSLYANSPEERNSITTALNQLKEAKNSLETVNDTAAYKKAASTYSARRKENGLPVDSFREFIKSHGARLSNRLAGRLTENEKEVLRQRKINLDAVREEYIALQQKALA
jgi:hypothetical protein